MKRVLDFLERDMFSGILFHNGMLEVNEGYSICFVCGDKKEWLEVNSKKLFCSIKERILLDKFPAGCEKRKPRL